MRNLKRALSLLLSSTMVLGMVVMGGSAAGYQDVDASNDNQEAIEVLQAVGIMSGVDDKGNFNPDGSLTRNEMAVVMAHLLNLDYDYYRGVNTFTDVPEWAAPYVAACVAEGVTAGIGNGLYGGDQKITAAQAGLMVMKALGYFQNQEDFGGDWQVATIRQASYINLFDKVNSNAETALTRGQVAQLVLNGLKSDMVSFTGDKGVQIGDVTVGYHAEYTPKTSSAVKYNSIVGGRTDIAPQGQYYIQLGEELYNGDLKLRDGSDDFNRPSRVWSYDGKEIGTYAKKELMVASYTEGVSGKELYDLLSYTTINESNLDVYLDGENNPNNIDKDYLVRSNNDDLDGTGNGVLTEVYLDNNAKEITIVSINTWLAQATADYSETKEYAPLTVYTGLAGGRTRTATYNVDVEDVPAVSGVTNENFYLVNISKKDNSTQGEITAIQDAKVLENTAVTKWSKSTTNVVSKLTADGTEYSANVKAFYDEDTLEDYDLSLLTDMSYNVYLDQYGYAIGVSLYEGTMKYVFITGYDRNESNLSVKTATAGAIFTDGTMKEIQVNVQDTNENIENSALAYAGSSNTWKSNGTQNGDFELNHWYTYTVNESGVYTLKPARMTTTLYDDVKSDNSGFEDVTVNTANVSVKDNVGSTNTRVYGEDDSIFITVDMDVVDTTIPQVQAITEVTGVYTGIDSVDLEINTDTDTITGNPNFNFAGGYNTADDAIIKGQVYTVYDKNNYIIAAVAVADAVGSVSNYAYILSDEASNEHVDADGTYYWDFDAIVGGEIKTLTAKSEYGKTVSPSKLDQYNVQELRFDADGYVVKIVDLDNSDFYAYAQATDDTKDITDYLVYDVDSNSSSNYLPDTVTKCLELSYQNNTMYITNDQTDMGLYLNNAKAIVIQTENGKLVKTEFDSVSAALSRLADPNTDTTDLEYVGTITAVLNSNGTAAWVVFNSKTPLVTGSTGGYDPSVTGNIPTSLAPASSAVLNSATVAANGRLALNLTYTAPSYVAEGSVPQVDIDIYSNGLYWDTISTGDPGVVVGAVDSGKSVITYRSNTNAYDYGATLSFKIVDESFTAMKLQYVDASGAPIEGMLKANYDEQIKVGTGAPIDTIDFALDTNSTSGTATYIIKQGTRTLGSGTLTSSPNWGAAQALAVNGTVTDDAVVTVEITMTGMLTQYNVTNSTTKASISGSTDDSISISLDKSGMLNDGTAVTVSATIHDGSNTALDNYAYLVSIDGVTGTGTLTTDSKTTVGTFTVSDDVTFTDADVHVTAIPKLAVKSISWTNNEVVVTFNRAVNIDSATIEEGTIASGGVVESAALDETGKILTIKVTGGALAASDTLTASGIVDAEYVANVVMDSSNPANTITIAAGTGSTFTFV